MKTADLMTCLVLFASCRIRTSEADSSWKWTKDSSSSDSGEDCEHVKSSNDAIVLAAYNRDWKRIHSFIQNGFSLDAVDPDGRSLAMMAAESGQWEMVHWLREEGADVDILDNLKRSVLHVASSHRRWHDMKMLVTNGSNINVVDSLGRTPTIMAASYKEWEIVQWLIEQGADVNARDGFGRSILLLAASYNNWRFAKWLLSKGADPLITDQNKRTLLHLATIADNLEVVQILVEDFDADFNQEDRSGMSPINLAATSNDPKGAVYNYLVYMREMKTQTSTYRRGNAEYKIRELSLMKRVQKMYEVMSKGESSLNIKMYGRVILVLGNLRSGKSTLIKYLTGGINKLTSQPVVEGSGLYKIVPLNGTAIPTSPYPQLVDYKEKGVVFCDGPRFSDMGTISQDLTAMHFLKKVTEKFKRVKLVFTVSHLTVKRGMNAEEFITFLQHSTSFITNFTHFSTSSCIVVTKFDGPRIGVPDSQLERAAGVSISKAAESLMEELGKKYLPVEKRTFYQRALDFLLIFLKRNKQGGYDRIKVFRRPELPGPLIMMERMTWSKGRLSDYIFHKMPYVKVKRSHFGYPMSDTTLMTIYKFEQATNREITSAMTSVTNHVEDQLFSRARNSEDVFKIRHWFREGCKRVEEITKLISNKYDASSMLFNIRLALEHVEIYPRRISTYTIEHLNNFFEFLQQIAKNELKTTPSEWRDPFRMLLISIRHTRDWYDFLAFLYQRLLEHDFQRNREKYDVSNLENWGTSPEEKGGGLFIDGNNIETFLKILDKYDIRRIEAIELRHFHDFEIDSLNRILKFTIKDKSVLNCKEHFYTGSYVSLKSVLQKCTPSKNEAKLKIFATNTIFIDINLSNTSDVVIIAPTWAVTVKTWFNLGSKSSFRGIGKNFINIQQLTITTTISGRPSPSDRNEVVLYELGKRNVSLPQDINDYRFYAVEHLKDKFVSKEILEFLSGIDNSPQVLGHYDTKILLKELMGLEEKYNNLKETIDFLPMYESLLKRIEVYSSKRKANEDDEHYELALTHLYTVVMSKVSTLKQGRRDNLVLNIAEFFRLSSYIIEEVKEKGNQIAVSQFKDKLKTDLEKKMNEGRNMVKTKVGNAVKDILREISKSLKKLFESLAEKRRKSQAQLQKLEDEKRELQVRRKELENQKEELEFRKDIMSILGMGVYPFIGHCIHTLFWHSSFSFFFDRNFVLIVERRKRSKESSLTAPAKNISLLAENSMKYATNDVNNAIQTFQDLETQIQNTNKPAYEKIKNIFKEGYENIKSIAKDGKFNNLEKTISLFSDRVKRGLQSFNEESKSRRFSFYDWWWYRHMYHYCSIFERIALYRQFYYNNFESIYDQKIDNIESKNEEIGKEIEETDKKIESVQQDLKQQKEYEHAIYHEFYPILDSVKIAMSKFMDNPEKLSSIELSLSGFEMGTVLRNAKRVMSRVSKSDEDVQAEMRMHMDNMMAAIDVQVATFQKLQDYTEQAKMTQNLHDLANPEYFKFGYPADIANDINKLDLMISSNILLSHHARAVGALKQWVFPFAHDYLGMFQIPKQLNYKKNTTELVKCAKEVLEKIQLTILTDAAIPTKRDRCTLNNYFYYRSPKGPFYIWKNTENGDFIVSLLSGEEVTANVDINQKLNFNAVKFRYIKLSFHAINKREQQELDELLKYFEVKMTHLGNSHFHCDGKIYTMTSDSLEIRYSLLEISPGEHATVNEIFNKLRKGDVMLSPYATWKFQLLDTANEGSFGKLLAFAEDIDVIFEGEGQYLNEDCISQCSNNMDEYYKVDGTV